MVALASIILVGRVLIDQHLAVGQICPSLLPYASPSFIIPKADTKVSEWLLPPQLSDSPGQLPIASYWWYPHRLHERKIWGKIDLMNVFFHTLVHPEHIKYMATLTPFGLWEWVIMPMGLRNSPATYQQWVMLVLWELIEKICHVYLDNIIIWLSSLVGHKENISDVLQALKMAHLYYSMKKSTLFASEIDFLGHHISTRGIKADLEKVTWILNWPAPTSAKHVHQFLGLVRYIAQFLPSLAEHTTILTPWHPWQGSLSGV